MPSITVKETFLDMSEAEVQAHVQDTVAARPSGIERRQIFAYLGQTLAADRRAVRSRRKLLAKASKATDEAFEQNSFDYTGPAVSALFDVASGVDFAALCTQDDQHVICKGHDFSGELLVSGDNVHVDGQAAGSARTGNLVCTTDATVLHVTGSNCIISGIKFSCGSADRGVRFGAGVDGVTIRDCIFESDGNLAVSPENRWFWMGTGLKGKVRLENCRIYNFNGWGLGDLTTESSAAAAGSELDQVRIQDNVFHNCTGSFAIRGVQASPTKYCRIWNNETKFTDGIVMHASYWSVWEVNNCKTVICKKNVLTGGTRIGSGQGRGFLQTWSKDSGSWHIEFSDNTIAGIDYVVQLAATSAFYSPDQGDDRFDISSEAGKVTDVTYGLSQAYPWDNAAWAPANVATYASRPSGSFADSLQNA